MQVSAPPSGSSSLGPGGSDPINLDYGVMNVGIVEPFNPILCTSTAAAQSSGDVVLTCFTQPFAFTTASTATFALWSGSAGATTLTLARVGLYLMDASFNLLGPLIVSGQISATIPTVANTAFTTSAVTTDYLAKGYTFPTQLSLLKNSRYALAMINVGTTPTTLKGVGNSTGFTAQVMNASLRKIAPKVTGQTDLPSGATYGAQAIAAASLANCSGGQFYFQIT